MNIICVAGQLGKDAEMRHLNNGDPVLTFSVADSQGREKKPIWWRCALFGKRAESLAQYLTKGQSVTITGNVTEREYEKDGVTKFAQEIRVQDVALQGGQRQQQDNSQQAPAPSQREQARDRQHAASRQGSRPQPQFSDMDDDIPFMRLTGLV